MSVRIPLTAPAHTVAALPAAGGSVAHCQRHMEPWLLLAVGAHVALLACSDPEGAVLWPFVFVAALVGGWAWLPAGGARPGMAMRGLLLVVAACLVHAQAAPVLGGAAGLLMFWLGVVVLYDAALLPPGWRVCLLVLALLGLLGFAPRGIVEVPSAVMAQAGLVCVLLGLAAACLGRFSGPRAAAPAALDSHTGLHSANGLLDAGERLLAQARQAEEPLSIAVFSFIDLLEVRAIYGGEVRTQVVRKLVQDLRRVANHRGIAARTGLTEFTVVFPNRDVEDVEEAIEKVLGHPACIELDADGDEIVLVPDVIIRMAGSSDSFAGLHGASSAALLARQQAEMLRRTQLRRERERHSRPTPLEPSVAQAGEAASASGPGALPDPGTPALRPA